MDHITQPIEAEIERRLEVMKLAKEMAKIADRYPRIPGTRPGTAGTVYVIHAQSTNLYKIGLTRTQVHYRIKSLQTGSPFTLELIAHADTAKPEELEKTIHTQLSSRRVNGEWFELDKTTLDSTLRLLEAYTLTERRGNNG